MTQPALDLSEIIGPYKDDARRSVQRLRDALGHWDEVAGNGPARQELRMLAHQLRGSGRTYGFTNVTRIGKALERLMIKLQSDHLKPNERLQKAIGKHIDRLAEIFKP